MQGGGRALVRDVPLDPISSRASRLCLRVTTLPTASSEDLPSTVESCEACHTQLQLFESVIPTLGPLSLNATRTDITNMKRASLPTRNLYAMLKLTRIPNRRDRAKQHTSARSCTISGCATLKHIAL